MKAWVVRFASLYVFDVVLLLLIGLLLPSVSVGWAVLWAALVLTAAALWVKPLVTRVLRGMAARSAGQRTRLGERLVQWALVFVVQLIVWVLVVWLSGVHVRGWLWGWVIPPVLLLIGWAVYAAIDDRIEAKAGQLYDQATGGSAAVSGRPPRDGSAAPSPRTSDLADGLTAEQRRMLDDLGKG